MRAPVKLSPEPVCTLCGKHPARHSVYECRASLAKQLSTARELLRQWTDAAIRDGWVGQK